MTLTIPFPVLRLFRRSNPAVEPYKCCAPRAGEGSTASKSWLCDGWMRPRTRTLRYEGETLIEVECDRCHRTAYAPKDRAK